MTSCCLSHAPKVSRAGTKGGTATLIDSIEIIEDNGVGLDEANFKSFRRLDSRAVEGVTSAYAP
jgi:hypothetical protein